jgi:demethylmenaquinone methyltransferase/2-methoxy-6-polyprenyl-1,4-benzoquinol methylase
MVEAPLPSKTIQRLYDFLCPLYDYLTRYEISAKEKGLAAASIRKGDHVLEVGFGTGKTVNGLADRVGQTGLVCGVDLSLKMVQKTRSMAKTRKLTCWIDLQLGDARYLPYTENVFDVVFNSYVLDLMAVRAIPTILKEYKRVLKPGGRLVLVNLSKGERWHSNMKVYEWFYGHCPTLLGGCRPILTKSFLEALGFRQIHRELVIAAHIVPSEIVCGVKPFMS